MKQLFFASQSVKVLASKELQESSYQGGTNISTSLRPDMIRKINSQSYYTGLSREEYVYVSKLEDLYIRKVTKDQKDTKKEKEALARKIKEKKKVHLDDSILGKRGLELDQKISQVEKLGASFLHNTPEIKLKYKIEYAKDFLDRSPIDDRSIEPDVLRYSFNDVHDQITCVESTPMNRVMLFGTVSGKILGFYFYEKAGENSGLEKGSFPPKQSSNQNVGDKNQKEGAAPENKDNLEKIIESKAQDFALEVRQMEFNGHKSAVTSMSINYDSSYFISGSVDSSIMLWNLQIGHCLAIFKGHLKSVWAVKMSPRGHYFLSGGSDSIMFLWQTNNGTPIMSFVDHEDDVIAVDFSENLHYVCSTSRDKTFRIWTVDNAQLIRVIFFPSYITSFKLNRSGNFLVAGSCNGDIYLWSMRQIQPVKIDEFKFDE